MYNCLLCDKLLRYSDSLNLEHYVPQVLIRNFDILGIPKDFDYALRINEFGAHSFNVAKGIRERVQVPISNHKIWATFKTHEKCNLEASDMCQDLKYIIDHIDGEIDDHYFCRPLKYYAKIWDLDLGSLQFILKPSDDLPDTSRDNMVLYRPGLLDCGRLIIKANDLTRSSIEKHTIYLGTQEALDEI